MRQLLTTLLCLAAFCPLQAEVRWNTAFSERYHSETHDADVAFGIRTPPRVDGIETYPLVVVLNGGPRVLPSEKFPHFQVRPSRNRIWG